MPYAILRFQKKKSGGVTACYAHNERKKEAYKSNPDIKAARKPANFHLVLQKQTYRREAQRLIKSAGCKTRRDSTIMVESLITASPEFMSALPPPEQREYFTHALAFMESKLGKDNIIAAVIHMDEKTPHMHLSFCPITEDGKLSAILPYESPRPSGLPGKKLEALASSVKDGLCKAPTTATVKNLVMGRRAYRHARVTVKEYAVQHGVEATSYQGRTKFAPTLRDRME